MLRWASVMLVILTLSVTAFAADAAPAAKDTATSGTIDYAAASYAIGVQIGRNMKTAPEGIDTKGVLKGFSDIINGNALAYEDKALVAAMSAFQEKMMQEQSSKQKVQQAEMQSKGVENQKEADEYLAKNKTAEGVKVDASGIQYKILASGTGKTPGKTDKVEVNYKGTFIDGTVFDSSYDRGQSATFGVSDVIPGWTTALMMMKEGDKWQIVIPPSLAYGPNGPGDIGSNRLLIFEVELIKVIPGEAAQ
jgi:FKBP-type peptidyl-prolyl cis-trans isomerase